jgi:hypothetical protein
MERRTPTPPNVINPIPATPQRIKDSTADGKLKSTPSNRGTAAVAEHLNSVLCVVLTTCRFVIY